MSFQQWKRQHHFELDTFLHDLHTLLRMAYEAGVREGESHTNYQPGTREPFTLQSLRDNIATVSLDNYIEKEPEQKIG
jgi:hypothetical protein